MPGARQETPPVPEFDLASYHHRRRSTTVGAAVRYRAQTTSTMDDARAGAAALGVASAGTVYVAAEQLSGRGRQQRQWVSAPNSGLYVTFHLCPARRAALQLFSVAGALAVADTVHQISAIETTLKWPNDVLAGGRKLAGVLAESSIRPQRTDVFLGIGVNVRRTAAMPPEVAVVATSIEEAGAEPPPLEVLLAELAGALERHARLVERGPASLIDDWRQRLTTLGRTISLALPDGSEATGEAVDVNDSGELMLRHGDGSIIAYAAGDVTTL